MRLPLPWLLALTTAALALLLLGSLATGPMALTLSESLRAIYAGQGSGIAAHKLLIVQEIRLPRTLLCIAVGGILLTAGLQLAQDGAGHCRYLGETLRIGVIQADGVTVTGEMAGDTDAHQSRAEYRQA